MRIADALFFSLHSYYEWCRKNPTTSGYQLERIDAHRAMADEYLGEFANGFSPGGSAKSKSRRPKVQPAVETSGEVVRHPDQQIAKLRKILKLSADQVEKIKPIVEAREAKVIEVRGDRSLDAEVRRLTINDLVRESKAKIHAFLSDEQKTILVQREQVHNEGKKA